MTTYGAALDVSYAQGIVDWNAVHQSNSISAVWTRATFGTNPADDDGVFFKRNHDSCKLVGIPIGAYHFFRFDQDGTAQAIHFLQQVDGRWGDLMPMVDVEEQSNYGASVEQMVDNLSIFITDVEQAFGCRMIIYTNADTWNNRMGGSDAFNGHFLWAASYGGDQPDIPHGWTGAAIWQWSDGKGLTPVPGFNGPVDRDTLLVPITLLRRKGA